MTKEMRLLSARPGALQGEAAVSPGRQAKPAGQEQRKGCELAGFLVGAAIVLLLYDNSSQALLLSKL